MDAFFTATAVVALAEIGDKTQLLAILLASRFHRPLPIILGILVATLANHLIAAVVGSHVATLLDGRAFRYAVAASFMVMAVWALIPDNLDEGRPARPGLGPFVTTVIAFFLIEMGDKTQIATVALAASFHNVPAITAGTTLGMMLANVPAVFLGEAIVRVVPLKAIRISAAALFLALGLWLAAATAGIVG